MIKQDESKRKEKQVKDMIAMHIDEIIVNKLRDKISFCCSVRENGTQKSCCIVEFKLDPAFLEKIGEKITQDLTSLLKESRKQQNNVNDTIPMTV